ncbi:MAG TPA: MazG nucleotide pyrophosphohydrolase domain-containing protein [Planctomycetaceae bacterium]|nr:MazG nucleotide pyrophosphohydrolase domain-containing protein [Planctomycetaceae bacterium]
MQLSEVQQFIDSMYGSKDSQRGIDGTFMWFMEEVGELAASLRGHDQQHLALEFADVLAWLVTLANIANVDLTDALHQKYGTGCPGCGQLVCQCGTEQKP